MNRLYRFSFVILWCCAGFEGRAAEVKEAWAVVFGEPVDDEPVGNGVDIFGNVYVSGQSTLPGFMLLKYDAGGRLTWERRFGADAVLRAMAVDSQGNVWLTGILNVVPGGEDDFVTVRYSPNGDLLWESRFDDVPADDGSPSTDQPEVMALDPDGNCYVGGYTSNLKEAYSVVVKYDPMGREAWAGRVSRNSSGRPKAIAIDADRNVLVTGTLGLQPPFQFATFKFDPGGKLLWDAYRLSEDRPGAVEDLAVDAMGNVFVTGYGDMAERSCTMYVTVKYNPDGTEAWTARRYGGGPCFGPMADRAKALALGNDGRVYVTGSSWSDTLLFTLGLSTFAYSEDDGGDVWNSRVDGEEGSLYYAKDIALDAQGNIYVLALHFVVPSLSESFVVVKYDAEGKEIWTARRQGLRNPGLQEDLPVFLAVDPSGNVHVTTIIPGKDDRFDFLTVKYVEVPTSFRRGDANADSLTDLSDAVFTLLYLFAGGPAPTCTKSADSNDDGRLEISDPIYLLTHLFLGGPAPSAPFPDCGTDPTQDGLECLQYAPCRC